MRILFASLSLPYPPVNGHRLRTWAMVRALRDQGHRVSVVSFAEPEDLRHDLTPLRTTCDVVDLVPVPHRRHSLPIEAARRLTALASPLPYGAWKFRSPEFRRRVEHRLAQGAYGAVICDGIYNAANIPTTSVPVLLNKDDVAHVILDRYLRLETNPLRRAYGGLELRRVRRWEGAVCRRSVAVLACSDVDAVLLARLAPATPIVVVPNAVDTAHYRPMPGAEPSTILFQGGLDWFPNRDAVAHFIGEILPAVRRLAPNALFRVAGRTPDPGFPRRFCATAGVEFTGTVPDMRTEIARAAVCVVPLRIGSGTRMKILEAGAMGKAIVSTTLGAEGLRFRDGTDIAIADSNDEFAAAVAALLRDESRRERLASAARQVVETQYSLPVFQHALAGAMTRVGA